MILLFAILLCRRDFKVTSPGAWNFFFLGAGFLLLETQMVSRLALYFGSTWLVNCIVLSAILLVLVLANLCVNKLPPNNLRPFYVALVACLLAIYSFLVKTPVWGTRRWHSAYCGILSSALLCWNHLFRNFPPHRR